MSRSAICPACGANDLDVCRYDAMMVLRTDLALFALRCPHCDASVSIVHSIPPQLRATRFASPPSRWGAGMGQE